MQTGDPSSRPRCARPPFSHSGDYVAWGEGNGWLRVDGGYGALHRCELLLRAAQRVRQAESRTGVNSSIRRRKAGAVMSIQLTIEPIMPEKKRKKVNF